MPQRKRRDRKNRIAMSFVASGSKDRRCAGLKKCPGNRSNFVGSLPSREDRLRSTLASLTISINPRKPQRNESIIHRHHR